MASSLIVDGDFSHLKFIPSLHEGGKYRVRYGASQVLEKTKVRSHRNFQGTDPRIFPRRRAIWSAVTTEGRHRFPERATQKKAPAQLSRALPAAPGPALFVPARPASGTRAARPGQRVSLPCVVLTGRKPRLLFLFVGVLLLRFAERQLFALLFQLPPRFTRLDPEDGPRPVAPRAQPRYGSHASTPCGSTPLNPNHPKMPAAARVPATSFSTGTFPL